MERKGGRGAADRCASRTDEASCCMRRPPSTRVPFDWHAIDRWAERRPSRELTRLVIRKLRDSNPSRALTYRLLMTDGRRAAVGGGWERLRTSDRLPLPSPRRLDCHVQPLPLHTQKGERRDESVQPTRQLRALPERDRVRWSTLARSARQWKESCDSRCEGRRLVDGRRRRLVLLVENRLHGSVSERHSEKKRISLSKEDEGGTGKGRGDLSVSIGAQVEEGSLPFVGVVVGRGGRLFDVGHLMETPCGRRRGPAVARASSPAKRSLSKRSALSHRAGLPQKGN